MLAIFKSGLKIFLEEVGYQFQKCASQMLVARDEGI